MAIGALSLDVDQPGSIAASCGKSGDFSHLLSWIVASLGPSSCSLTTLQGYSSLRFRPIRTLSSAVENLRCCKVVGVIDKVMTRPGTGEVRLGLDQRECKLEGPGSWDEGACPPRTREYPSIPFSPRKIHRR